MSDDEREKKQRERKAENKFQKRVAKKESIEKALISIFMK